MWYFFDLDGDGEFTEDMAGSECASPEQMRQKAVALLAEVVAHAASGRDNPQLSVRVRDAQNKQVFAARLSIEASPQ